MSAGEKNKKFELEEKMKKEENYIKKGEKGLKNASFLAINSKKIMAQGHGSAFSK